LTTGSFRADAFEVGGASGASNVAFAALKKRWFVGGYSTAGAREQMKQSGYVDAMVSIFLALSWAAASPRMHDNLYVLKNGPSPMNGRHSNSHCGWEMGTERIV